MHWSTSSIEVSPERSAQIVREPFLLDCAYQQDESNMDRWFIVVIVQLLDTTIGTAERDALAGLDDAALDGIVRDLLPHALAKARTRIKQILTQFDDFSRSLS